jgi:hypothetical protein
VMIGILFLYIGMLTGSNYKKKYLTGLLRLELTGIYHH